MNEYTSICLKDIYKAERCAMRKAAEAAASGSGPDVGIKLVAMIGGIRAIVDEIESAMRQEDGKGGGEK